MVLRSIAVFATEGSWCTVATVGFWTGAETKALRQAMRLSVRNFAARLGVDARTVTKWENRGVSIELLPETQAIMDTALAQASDEVKARFKQIVAESRAEEGPVDDTGREDPFDPMKRRTLIKFSLATAASASMGDGVLGQERGVMRRQAVHPELLNHYETLTKTYRQLDYQSGSTAVYDETVAQLNRMLAMADSVPTSLYQRYELAVGDSAQLAAWLAIDHQDYGAARHYTALALSSAQEAEDPTLHAYVLGIKSYIHLHAKRGSEAVRLLYGALRLAGNPKLGVNHAVHSWLCEAMGEAQALAGERAEGAVFLARAERLFDRVEQADVPAWLGFYNGEEHITRLKGRCLVKLSDSQSAVITLENAVAALPVHYVRERSGTLIDLAAAHLLPKTDRIGDSANPEAAAVAAFEAWELAVDTGSGRNQRRIRELLPQFEPYGHLAEIQTLQAAVR